MILLIDGPSGSGKTVFSQKLHGLLGWPVLHVEDMYQGWTGLSAASEAVAATVLNPALGASARGFRRWDWCASCPAEWVPTPGRGEESLIIEGCGALTARNLAAARALGDAEAWGIWLNAPAEVRYARAMARDDLFESHWDMWAEQERRHYESHKPWELADWISLFSRKIGTGRLPSSVS